MGLKLFLEMLCILTIIIVALILGSIFVSRNIVYLAILVPIGLFAIVIYKFRKEGVVAIFYFLGISLLGYFALRGVKYDCFYSFYGNECYEALNALIVGLVFVGIGRLLERLWKVKVFK